MERFNLDTWLEDKSRKVIDDNGFPVEIIHWNAHVKYPVVYLDHNGVVVNVSTDGMYDSDPNHGLFFADDKFTEFEKELEKFRTHILATSGEKYDKNGECVIKNISKKLLDLAREGFIPKKQYEEDLDKAYKNADKVQFNRGMDEVLTNPQKYFHIGDTIRLKNSNAEYTITSIFNGRYYGDGWSLGIQEAADHYELVKEQDCDLENTIDLLEAIAEDQEKDYCPYNAAKLRKTSSWLKSIKKKQQWTPEDKSMYLRVLGILGKCYMKVLPDNVKEELEWMKGLDKRIELNPKQELTEEDKEVLNTIISDVRRTYISCGIGTDEYNIRTKALDFLKSIKDKPKQEWTEKDMVMITSIISDSEQGALLDPEQINWLKQKFNKQ